MFDMKSMLQVFPQFLIHGATFAPTDMYLVAVRIEVQPEMSVGRKVKCSLFARS